MPNDRVKSEENEIIHESSQVNELCVLLKIQLQAVCDVTVQIIGPSLLREWCNEILQSSSDVSLHSTVEHLLVDNRDDDDINFDTKHSDIIYLPDAEVIFVPQKAEGLTEVFDREASDIFNPGPLDIVMTLIVNQLMMMSTMS